MADHQSELSADAILENLPMVRAILSQAGFETIRRRDMWQHCQSCMERGFCEARYKERCFEKKVL